MPQVGATEEEEEEEEISLQIDVIKYKYCISRSVLSESYPQTA
jgi:hypothetical protein